MAFCTACGKEVEGGIKFCPYCGVELAEAAAPVADPQDIKDTRILALQAYLGILVLEPIFAAPKSSVYARFHANQGLILLIVNAIGGTIGSIAGALSSIHWALAILCAPITLAINAALIFLAVIGIIHAIKGEMKELPIIGKYRILKMK